MPKLSTLRPRVGALDMRTARPPQIAGDEIDKAYGSQAWRKLARSVIDRDAGICHICGKPGADTAHHLEEKREGGTDDPRNLRAVHRGCHNRAHGRRGWGV